MSGKAVGRMRSSHRVWRADVKGRIVRESPRTSARVCDVARSYGFRAQQLTGWRRAARSGHLALISDDESDAFVPIEISHAAARKAPKARIELSVGKVILRAKSDMSSLRLAEIAAALERQP